MFDWNNEKYFKSDIGSVALKNNTWGIPGISHQAPKIYTLLNWTVSTIED